ncbi:uncharacterized protein [Lepisosteus oculatus]|uniref:uncharacterized protein n=1 Tax=Lepisosteus oculatus TaxID=7918 RepID=UPI0035F5176E
MRTLTVLGLLAAVWGALRTEGFSVQGPREPLVARPGDEVLLPCSVDSAVPLHELEVEWRRSDYNVLVLLFSKGESRPESQHQSYRGRAELFPQEIPRGNFSLMLANVTAEDTGVYRCAVHTEQGSGETTVELKEQGFSSVHVWALVLAFSVPVLWILIFVLKNNLCEKNKYCYVLNWTFVSAPSVSLSISFILWGVIEGFLEEVIMCVTVNLLRIVLFLAINMMKSVSIGFSIIHFVVITVMWSVALWEYFKSHTPDTAVTAGIGLACTSSLLSSFCGVFIKVYFMWRESSQSIRRTVPFACSVGSIVVLILFRASIERLIVGYLTGLIAALIALVMSLTLQRIYQRIYLQTVDDGRWAAFCLKSAVMIFFILLFVLSLLYLDRVLDTLRGGPGLMCEVLFLWILAVGTVFIKEDKGLDDGLLWKFIFALPLLSSIALATDLILNTTKGYRAVKDLRLVVVPLESLYVICWVVCLMYNYYKDNETEIQEKLQTLLRKQERDSNAPEEERSPEAAQLNKESD